MRRNLHFLGELTEDGLVEHDRDEVRQALLDLEGALHRLGGRVAIAAVRQQVSEDSYITTGMIVTYNSHDLTPREAAEIEQEPSEDGAAVAG
jgi:hypothetical protein